MSVKSTRRAKSFPQAGNEFPIGKTGSQIPILLVFLTFLISQPTRPPVSTDWIFTLWEMSFTGRKLPNAVRVWIAKLARVVQYNSAAPGVRGWYRFIVTWVISFGGEPKRSLTSQTPRGSAVLQGLQSKATVFPAWGRQRAAKRHLRWSAFSVLAGRRAHFGELAGGMQQAWFYPGRSY